jgi:hypothetical protein
MCTRVVIDEELEKVGMPKLSDAAALAWYLMAVADKSSASIPEVQERIKNGTFFDWLKESHKANVTLEDESAMLDYLADVESLKSSFEIKRNGLLLLAAACIGVVQKAAFMDS